MNKQDYYKSIAAYYDREAEFYAARQSPNKTLQKIRDDFRLVAEKFINGEKILDIGCGTGTDLCYFAGKYPDKFFTGLDISANMIDEAAKNIRMKKLKNVHLFTGHIDNIEAEKYDFIYIFFGALNTVADLHGAVEKLYNSLNENGRILVTFVNKWYPMGMLSYLRRLKFNKAFERLKSTWWGYSEAQSLASKTYFGFQIRKDFQQFTLLFKRGYSIVYPAWYQDRITTKLGRLAPALWRMDELLSKTPFWSWGEYTLFVFEKDRS